MAAGRHEVNVNCTWGEKLSLGGVTVRSLSRAERIQRGAKVTGIAWGVAILCVFIPILHFVLVPSFLIGGLVLGVMNSMERGQIVSSHLGCPNCSAEVPLVNESVSWPKQIRCSSCSVTLAIAPTT